MPFWPEEHLGCQFRRGCIARCVRPGASHTHPRTVFTRAVSLLHSKIDHDLGTAKMKRCHKTRVGPTGIMDPDYSVLCFRGSFPLGCPYRVGFAQLGLLDRTRLALDWRSFVISADDLNQHRDCHHVSKWLYVIFFEHDASKVSFTGTAEPVPGPMAVPSADADPASNRPVPQQTSMSPSGLMSIIYTIGHCHATRFICKINSYKHSK